LFKFFKFKSNDLLTRKETKRKVLREDKGKGVQEFEGLSEIFQHFSVKSELTDRQRERARESPTKGERQSERVTDGERLRK